MVESTRPWKLDKNSNKILHTATKTPKENTQTLHYLIQQNLSNFEAKWTVKNKEKSNIYQTKTLLKY